LPPRAQLQVDTPHGDHSYTVGESSRIDVLLRQKAFWVKKAANGDLSTRSFTWKLHGTLSKAWEEALKAIGGF